MIEKFKKPPAPVQNVGKINFSSAKPATPAPTNAAPNIKTNFSQPSRPVVKPNKLPAPLFAGTGKSECDLDPSDFAKYPTLTNREILDVKELAETVDIADRMVVIQYGQEVNKKLADAVDEILEFAQQNAFHSKVSGDISALHKLINFNPNEDEASGFMSGLFKKKKTPAERINDVITSVANVIASVEQNVDFFLQLIPSIDDMLDKSKKHHSGLQVLIAAGKERIEVFERRRKPKLEALISGNNVMAAQNARDELDIAKSFIKRVEVLEITLTQNEMTLAQIRLTQATNVKMIETLNHITTNLAPMWKHSLISAISTNNFDAVNKNKDVLSKSICDIISPTSAAQV